jgi:hypothetical protein
MAHAALWHRNTVLVLLMAAFAHEMISYARVHTCSYVLNANALLDLLVLLVLSFLVARPYLWGYRAGGNLSAIGGLNVTHRFLPLPRSRLPTRHISLERGLARCTLSHNQLTGSQLTSCIIIIEVAWYHSHQLPTYRHFHLALVTPIHETTQHLTDTPLISYRHPVPSSPLVLFRIAFVKSDTHPNHIPRERTSTLPSRPPYLKSDQIR